MKNKRLNICIYSPYMPDHFGGGERYVLSVAEFLARTHHVSIALSTNDLTKEKIAIIRQRYQDFFQLNLNHIKFIASPLGPGHFVQKLLWTKQFDVLYYLTDGSLFFSLAKRNVLHIQFPFTHHMSGFLNRIKLKNWNVRNTNSQFTKDVIERNWKTAIQYVHTPYVDTQIFRPAHKKEKIILNVGRFFSHLHTKRQDILVKAFKNLTEKYPQHMKGWKLVLIGGVEDEIYAKKIANLAKDLPIKIIHNASAETLKSYYSLAQIYWHATGFGVDEFIHPMFVEHFGISTIEAMASGAIPIVINKGGQKELVEHGVNGFLWNEIESLEERTIACIRQEVDCEELQEKARRSVLRYSPSQFFSTLNAMIGSNQPIPSDISGEVSVIIPTFNGKKLLEKNISSIFESMRTGDELVIVDDASNDDTVDWLQSEFSLSKNEDRAEFDEFVFDGTFEKKNKKILIKLIQNKTNLRFAASCNKGVKLSTHELVFVVNNDVKLKSNTLTTLVPYFLNHNGQAHQIFGIGCLEEERKKGKIEYSGKNSLWFERGLFVHSKASEMITGETAWVSGGSGLFSKAKWQELQGFDRRFYPAYWEDIDLSARAKERGWQVLFDAEAVVEHHHESTNQTAFGQERINQMSFQNGMLFMWIHTNFVQKLQFLAWLPYHLVITNRRSHGAFLHGLLRLLLKNSQS